MSLRDIVAWNRLGLRLARLRASLEKDGNMNGYSFAITLRKIGEGLLHGLGPVVGLALYGFLTDSVALTKALESAGLSPTTVAALILVISGATRGLTNWLKNRNRPPAGPVLVPADPSGWRDR